MTIQIVDRIQDGHSFVEVVNERGEHLFCHVSREKAERTLANDHAILAAHCFSDISKAGSPDNQAPKEIDGLLSPQLPLAA